jgi:hypothetical protein
MLVLADWARACCHTSRGEGRGREAGRRTPWIQRTLPLLSLFGILLRFTWSRQTKRYGRKQLRRFFCAQNRTDWGGEQLHRTIMQGEKNTVGRRTVAKNNLQSRKEQLQRIITEKDKMNEEGISCTE